VVALDSVDLDLVIAFATIVATALIARSTHLPITALEIIAGAVLFTLLGFTLPTGTTSIITLGSLFIVFLAGFETGFGFLRANLVRALTVGLPAFLVPFAGLFLLLYYGIHAPMFISLVGATVLSDTSISITYTTLQQYDLADLPFGRLILASTLCINLAEDTTITTATVATTPGLLFTIAVLGALAAAAVTLPHLSRWIQESKPSSFTNVGTRSLLFSLAVLAFLSALVGVPGILFVFLMGLLLSRLMPPASWNGYLSVIRPVAFAVFIPLYFVAVGLKVDAGFVFAHWPLLVVLAVGAASLKTASLFPIVRRVFGPSRAAPVTVLMNTRLTSATVILTLMLGLRLITDGWYSIYVSVVVVLALTFAGAMRAFPSFRSPAAARELFRSEEVDSPGAPTPASGPSLPPITQL
jgi:Kef-type K+ transport system membrane component KefB